MRKEVPSAGYVYLEALQVGGVGPVLVVPDTSDAGEPNGDPVSGVQVRAGELGSSDLPHRGRLAGGGEGGGGEGGGRGMGQCHTTEE